MDEERLVITVLGVVDASVRQDGVGEVLVHGGDLGHLEVEGVEGETDESWVVEGADVLRRLDTELSHSETAVGEVWLVEACRLVATGREEEEDGVAVLDGQVGDGVNGVAGRVGVGEALVGELVDGDDERVLGVMCHQRLIHLVLELELGDVHETLRDLAAGALELGLRVGE